MEAAQSFEYKLTVHQLRPWPLSGAGSGGPQFIAIGWQRGKQTGAIDAVKAKVTAKGYGVYMFNEDLTITADLRKNPGGAPGFEKKFLQLAAISVNRGMTEDRPVASLGTVVINLADFTDTKRGPKKLAFRVSVGREITNALASIGKPEAPSLIVTMQAVKKLGARTLDRDTSISSRGSRITGDLSAFFGKDKHSTREPVPEEPDYENAAADVKTPAAEGGEAPSVGSTPGLPPSDMRATPAHPPRAVDSDGFEIDSSEDQVAAAAHRPASATRRPAFLNKGANGTAGSSPKGGPGASTSAHQKKSFSLLEEMNARKNRVAAIRGDPVAADSPTFHTPKAEPVPPEGSPPAETPAVEEVVPEASVPQSTPEPALEPAAAAGEPDDGAARRKTGKTTFIRDWLGSAEPAPGEGPSIRFPKATDGVDTKPDNFKPATFQPPMLEEENDADVGAAAEDDAAAEEPGRRQLAQSLSQARNHDLRMVLDQDRIHKESESFMKDLDDAAAAAVQAAEEMEEAPPLGENGHVAAVQETPDSGRAGAESSGASDDAEGGGKRRFAWQRRRSSVPDVPALPEDRVADLPPENDTLKNLGASLLKPEPMAGTEDFRQIEADQAHAERLAEQEQQFAEAERRTQQAEEKATEAERRASAAQERALELEKRADELHDQVAADAKAADAAEREAQARVDALLAQVKKQESAVAAAEARLAEVEAETRQKVAKQEETADVVLESAAASSSIALETGPLDGMSAKVGTARKAGKELKWRRASQGSAALNTAHSAPMDDADQKMIERLEHELCIVGILETAVHCCDCFHTDKENPRSQSHVTHTPARRLFRALISMPQEQAEPLVPVVLRAIRCRTSKQWADDVPLAFFWWSNVQMMRVFLHQLDSGSVVTVGDSSWLQPMLDPGLQEIGEEIFNGLVNMLWTDVMLPMQERSASRKASSDNTEEEAMMRWMASLEVANDRVSRALLHVEGFSALLLPLVQVALLARIDFLFYSNIMAVGGEEHPQTAFGGGGGWAVPPHMLPFSIEGRVSFQTGMQLKMAVMHMSHWAHDHDLRDKDGVMLYPFMRGTADVLMMKKDLLLDDETRLSVASALPVPALLHLLSHFAPDEFSPDEVDPAVLKELREVAAGLPDEMGSLQPYVPPPVEELQEFADREISEGARRRGGRAQSMAQVSVQIGDDSDAELQALTEDGGDPSKRFKLVQDLWGASHDRRDE